MAMSVFTMKLEAELRDEFMAAAEAAHRPASQLVRELMRDYLRNQRERQQYATFLRGKVMHARAQRESGAHQSDDAVEAEFEIRRQKTQKAVAKPTA